LLNVARCERAGDKTRLMLILHKFGSKDQLREDVEHQRREVENHEPKMNWSLRSAKDTLETKSVRCDTCGGTGHVGKSSYIRERGVVQPYAVSQKCPICNGAGTVNIPSEILSYFALLLATVNRLAELCHSFMEFSGDALSILSPKNS
jgi:hypothetical protein